MSIPSIEEISSMWFEDAHLDEHKLHRESLAIPLLHHKYYQMYIETNLEMSKIKEHIKKFEFLLEEYMCQSMGSDELDAFMKMASDRNITLPDMNKKILKPDIPKKIAGNSYIIKQNLKVCELKEKSDYLKSILAMISGRSFQIKDAINFIQFQAGN